MKILGLLLLLSWTSPLLQAQAPASLQHRSPPASDYVLGDGDQIIIHVADMEELPDKPITIDPAGSIDIPLAGRVQAAGLTIIQLKKELSEKLSTYITAPDISINLSFSGSEPVSVVGEVNNPGVHQLTGSKRLLEVISLSGGLKPDAGPNVIVTRQPRWGGIEAPGTKMDPTTGYITVTFSLDSLLSSKDPRENIMMRPDDVVSIPRADLVYVVGDVQKAGGFQLSTHETVSLLQALSLAQGLGPDSAARNARILRQVPGGDGTPREVPVDVNKILAGKAPDVQLYANDVLFIPRSGVKVTARRVMEAAIGIGTGVLVYR